MNKNRFRFLTGVLIALMSCTSSAAGRDIDDRLWILMESENFSVYSSVTERKTRDLLLHLETLRSVFVTYFGYGRNLDEKPTHIFVVGRQADYRKLGLPPNTAGIFMSNLRSNTIVIGDLLSMDESQVILHEYIHYLVRVTERFPFPMWWNEGFAEFASATRMTETTFDLGLPLEHRIRNLRWAGWLPWEDFLSVSAYEDVPVHQRGLFYAQSWFLVHFLQTRPTDTPIEQNWAAYLQELNQGAGPAEAFAVGFDLPMETLAQEIRDYRESGRLQYWRIPRDALDIDLNPSVDVVRQRDIQIQLGWLALANSEYSTARAWFDKAIQNRSKSASAFTGRASALAHMGHYEEARADFDHARELEPTNASSLVDYAIFEIDNAVRDDAPQTEDEYLDTAEALLTEARSMTGGTVEMDTLLAFIWLQRDEASVPAMQLLEGVIDRSPSDQWPAILLAESLFNNGRPEDAHDLAQSILRYDHGRSSYSAMARNLIARIQANAARDNPPTSKKTTPQIPARD